jgi:hypothetical protein
VLRVVMLILSAEGFEEREDGDFLTGDLSAQECSLYWDVRSLLL